MSRALTLASGVAVALLVGAGITGSPILVLLLAPVALLGLVWGRPGSGGSVADARWATTEDGNASAGAPVLVRGGPAAVARALGRVEGRLLFSSPWFAVGLGLSAVIIVMFAVLFADENNQSWAEWVQTTPWYVHPLVGMTVLASHRATTRAHRDRTEELFDVCPTAPETRTVGLVEASWVPALVATVFLGVFASLSAVRATGLHGRLLLDNAGDVVGAVLLSVGAVALGVALGRWIRFGLTPVVAVVAIAFVSTGISGIGGHGWNPYTQLSTAPTIETPSPVFADRPVWSHVLWIGALIVIVAVVALLRHRRDRVVVLSGVGAVVVAIVAAFGATAEMPATSAARIADLVARPESHQACLDIAGRAEVCAFPLHRATLARVAAEVAPVAAALPAQVGPITIRQVYEDPIAQLPPEVRRRLPRPLPPRPGNEIPLSGFDELGTFAGVRRDLPYAVVGLPTRPDEDLMPVSAAGQARGVVALWLSVRGLGPTDQLRRTTVPDPDATDPFEQGSLEGVGQCSTPSVVFSAQDLAAVHSVLGLEDRIVARVIESEWERWIDPSTGTDELLDAVGLPSAGPYDVIRPRPGEGC